MNKPLLESFVVKRWESGLRRTGDLAEMVTRDLQRAAARGDSEAEGVLDAALLTGVTQMAKRFLKALQTELPTKNGAVRIPARWGVQVPDPKTGKPVFQQMLWMEMGRETITALLERETRRRDAQSWAVAGLGFIVRNYDLHPDAANAAEALRLAGIDPGSLVVFVDGEA